MNTREETGILPHKIHYAVRNGIDQQLRDHDLTFSQSQILHYLHTLKDKASQKQLQDLMQLSHPTVVGIIQRLESHGFVKTYSDENDRRSKIIEATDKALTFRSDLESGRQKMQEKMYENFSEQEVDQLRNLLKKMYDNIRE